MHTWFSLIVVLPLVILSPPSRAQTPQSAPSDLSAENQQRFNDLLALIEGQNAPSARLTGARELLRQEWPATRERIVVILSGANAPAKIAVATALSDLADRFHSDYLDPVFAMLSAPEPEVRTAAIAALAGCPLEDVLLRLRSLALDDQGGLPARLAAIETLGSMTRRDALGVLIEALADAESPVCEPALLALERATATDFQRNTAAAREWWDRTRDTPLLDWQQLQIERLVRQARGAEQRARDLERRLVNVLRDAYFHLSESERPSTLEQHLSDASAPVRLLGLVLVQSHIAEGKDLADEIAGRARMLLAAPESEVRAAAARTIAALRDPDDAQRFLDRLEIETHAGVREALVNGLGYVGGTAAVEPLLALLDTADQSSAVEAVTALGRLAERGMIEPAARTRVVDALLAKFSATSGPQIALQERLLSALGRLADARCGATFLDALRASDSTPVRLAAVRGVAGLAAQSPDLLAPAGLAHEALADALIPVAGDPDLGVRRVAVETLAQLARSESHMQALWSRLSAAQEPDEAVRRAAWSGALRLLQGRSAADVLTWTERLPQNGATHLQRRSALLQLAAGKLDADPVDYALRGEVRTQLARTLLAAGRFDESIEAFLRALEDLHPAGSKQVPQVSFDLILAALLNDRYDARIGTALANGNPPLDEQWLWQKLAGEIEARLRPETIAQAAAMLDALRANPPVAFSEPTRRSIDELAQKAARLQQEILERRVNDALVKLRETPDDQDARDTILSIGPACAAILRDALLVVLSAEPLDREAERRLHDLLKAVQPDWPGFAPETPIEEKRRALESLEA